MCQSLDGGRTPPLPPGGLGCFYSPARGPQAMGVYGWGITLSVERLILPHFCCSYTWFYSRNYVDATFVLSY